MNDGNSSTLSFPPTVSCANRRRFFSNCNSESGDLGWRRKGLVSEKELLNVTSSLMPPGAEMPSLFHAYCLLLVSWNAFGLLAGILISTPGNTFLPKKHE